MAGFRDMFIDSAARRRKAREQYDRRLGLRTRLERDVAAYNATRAPGERERFVWADRVFTVGVKDPGALGGQETPMTVEETLRANHNYFQDQANRAKQLDEAARNEYVEAARADEQLNQDAVVLFSHGASHRRNKFVRRLYRAWLRGQHARTGRERDWIAQRADMQATACGGRTERRTKRKWPRKK